MQKKRKIPLLRKSFTGRQLLRFGHIFIQKFEILLCWDWKVGYYGKRTEIVMAMSSQSVKPRECSCRSF